MSEHLVALHFGPKDDPEAHDRILARSYGGLIQAVEDRGVETVVTRGSDHYDFEEGLVQEHWRLWRPEGGAVRSQKLGQLVMAELGSVRDYSRKLQPTEKHPLAMLNTPEVISYDNSKYKAYTDILHGMQGETHMLGADTADVFSSDYLVVKPDNGSGGRGVHIIGRGRLNDLMDKLMTAAPDTLHVVQEYVDMRQPFPSDIRGLDAEESDTLERLKDRKKELRVFTSYSKDGEAKLVPVARMMKEGDEKSDTWVFVDPDYIPAEIVTSAATAFDRLSDKTQTDEIFGAMDFMWGTTASQPEASWRAGELNMWKPAINRRKPEMGKLVDSALADQLVRMINGQQGRSGSQKSLQ